jgi:hydrogenase maturation protein HypF
MRPAIFRLAQRSGLAGFVRNDSEGVWIEVEGDRRVVREFVQALGAEAPPLARIGSIEVKPLEPRGDSVFRVEESETRPRTTAVIPPDAGTCDACLRELFDPGNRRYRYPFINCTDCGPRFSIVRAVPYDRAKTTMATFAMCAMCRAEYEDPRDRRYHAEPNACPDCGPRACIVVDGAMQADGDAAVAEATRLLSSGAVVAVKGLGGYQLAAIATDAAAVARLRAAKRRPQKPFAVMARDMEALEQIAVVREVARQALRSLARPILLLPMVHGTPLAEGIAPGLREVGVMLPATPLHHLLLQHNPLLVMTSGNRADEPIAKDEEEALASLAGIADAFLCHDRDIHTRADDSVVRLHRGVTQAVRRARGFVPEAILLGFDGPPVLAVGGQLKSTICMTRGEEAFLSQHIGDLDSYESQEFFEEVIGKLARLLGVSPVLFAHDLHPDYASTRWALGRPVERVPVQHHHAHLASCLAEHARTHAVIGVVFDGTGCGPEGDLWGGEFLVGDLTGFRRAGHLRPIALPGGEAAIRETWRLAAAALYDAAEPLDLIRAPASERDAVLGLLARRVAAPLATGAGRWFDAVAAIAGVRDSVTYEGQAAVELEAIASTDPDAAPYPFGIEHRGTGRPFAIDLRPLVRAIAADVRKGCAAARIGGGFHGTLALAVRQACRITRAASCVRTVALSGGCFQNTLLTEKTRSMLERDGFEVLVHRAVPPNDGGLALGQAAIAAYTRRPERRV